MDEQKRPRSREKKVVSEGKGVEKHGPGLGTGPLNNTGSYADRRQQAAPSSRPATTSSSAQRTGTGAFPRQSSQGSASQQTRPVSSFQQTRPKSAQPDPFRRAGSASASDPFHRGGTTIPPQTPKSSGSGSHTPYNSAVKQNASGASGRPYHSAVKQNGTSAGAGKAGGARPGCGLLPLILVVVLFLLFGGGKLIGLFGGDSDSSLPSAALPQTQSGTSQTGGSQSGTTSGSGSGTTSGTSSGTSSGTGTGSGTQSTASQSSGSLTDLLSSLLGSGSSSVYDFTGSASLGSGPSGASPYFTSSTSENSTSPDETVSRKAREKYTRLRGNGEDEVTLLVYMCGTDLESQQGMGTADLKEMLSASLSEKINLIIYTGGCTRWRNNVVSSSANQIWQIRSGAMYCLETDLGTPAMTSAETLSSFIRYGAEHFPANRMCLILWDHGGGSVSGYGYDERYGHSRSMSLSGINTALKDAGAKFDFIGFDACLMATLENGLMLSPYADYMIASEETEPGVGWYYTGFLNQLSQNTSLPTTRLGKKIADDFVDVCNQKCRGQATTLSVVDLAELEATLPEALKNFSIDTNSLIQNKQYKTVSSARSKTREFAQQSKIDQIDLVHFARNLGTDEGKKLAEALQSAVKYNRTGGGIRDAYGLSIYFPYKKVNKVSQMVSTYQDIGMDEEYTRCIQEFASLEVSGQVSAGTSLSDYGTYTSASPGLMDSLLGGGGYNTSYSSSGLENLLSGLFSSGSSYGPVSSYSSGSSYSTGSILDLFAGRSLTASDAAQYILENHFDPSALVWTDGRITLSPQQWSQVESLVKNVFFDDGSGFIDLGTDPDFVIEGNDLVGSFDGTWLSINRQPVAFYYLNTASEGDHYVISGYVPAILNGERVSLILNFDDERPYGYIAGAQKEYADPESATQAKGLIAIGAGDRLQFLCEYYDYDGNFVDAYRLGEEMTLGEEIEIANTPVASDLSACRVTYRFTDLYQQNYWTPALPAATK